MNPLGGLAGHNAMLRWPLCRPPRRTRHCALRRGRSTGFPSSRSWLGLRSTLARRGANIRLWRKIGTLAGGPQPEVERSRPISDRGRIERRGTFGTKQLVTRSATISLLDIGFRLARKKLKRASATGTAHRKGDPDIETIATRGSNSGNCSGLFVESSPAEFHREALAEPGVSVSTHPAPIIQPRTDGPHANARTTPTDNEQPVPASAVHDAMTVPAFDILS